MSSVLTDYILNSFIQSSLHSLFRIFLRGLSFRIRKPTLLSNVFPVTYHNLQQPAWSFVRNKTSLLQSLELSQSIGLVTSLNGVSRLLSHSWLTRLLFLTNLTGMSRDRSVRMRLERPKSWSSFPGRRKRFILLRSVHTGSRDHPTFNPTAIRGFVLRK